MLDEPCGAVERFCSPAADDDAKLERTPAQLESIPAPEDLPTPWKLGGAAAAAAAAPGMKRNSGGSERPTALLRPSCVG
jgi:hypothetical protein